MSERKRTGTNGSGGAPAQQVLPTNVWGAAGDEVAAQSATRASNLVASAGAKWTSTLAVVVAAGFGLTVSGTRDGGAVALSLLIDGRAVKKYAAHPDELEALLDQLHDHCSLQL